MVTDTTSRMALIHEFCVVQSKYSYTKSIISINEINEVDEGFLLVGLNTDNDVRDMIAMYQDMLDEKLMKYRKTAPKLEKNLMIIANNNKINPIFSYLGFTDRDLIRQEYEHMGFDLYAIETIHWICNATGWTKQQLEIMISDEGDCDFIESWVPPSDAF